MDAPRHHAKLHLNELVPTGGWNAGERIEPCPVYPDLLPALQKPGTAHSRLPHKAATDRLPILHKPIDLTGEPWRSFLDRFDTALNELQPLYAAVD